MDTACFILDDSVFQRVHDVLVSDGFTCERFMSETALMRAFRHRNFDLIVIDPGSESIVEERVFSWLNCRSGQSTPVLLISPSHSAERAACALEAGADDVIYEPFQACELLARVHAVLRRYDHRCAHRSRVELMDFTLERDSCLCLNRGERVDLTPREFAMAWLLFSNLGHYLTRKTISVAIWGVAEEIAGRTIEQHVYKLRKKLGLGPERGVTIRTAYARGYRLELCSDETQKTVRPASGVAAHDGLHA